MNKNSSARIWNKDFTILFIVNFIIMSVFQMPQTILSKYASELGALTSSLGLVTAVFSTAALITRPFAGIMTDRYDKKILLIISLIGICCSMFLYAAVDSFITLLLARVFHGIFFGINTTVSLTMAANTLSPSKMTKGIGFFGVGQVLGIAVGPQVGISLMNMFGFQATFFVAGICALFAIIISLWVKSDRTPLDTNLKKFSWKSRLIAVEAIIPATIALLYACAIGAVNSFLVLYGDERDLVNVGIFFTVNAITLIIIRPMVGIAADKIPSRRLIYFFGVSIAISMTILMYSNSITFLMVAAVFFGIGFGGSAPLFQSMCIKSVPVNKRGSASSTYYVGMDLGNTFGPIATGAIAAYSGYGEAFLCMIVPVFFGIMVMLLYSKKKKYNDSVSNKETSVT